MGCERSSRWRPPRQPLAPEVVLRASGPLRPRRGSYRKSAFRSFNKPGTFIDLSGVAFCSVRSTEVNFAPELELELIQSHMTQKPMLRGEVDARALRV